MNCEKCNERMRIEENTKISPKEYRLVYVCINCGSTLVDIIKTN